MVAAAEWHDGPQARAPGTKRLAVQTISCIPFEICRRRLHASDLLKKGDGHLTRTPNVGENAAGSEPSPLFQQAVRVSGGRERIHRPLGVNWGDFALFAPRPPLTERRPLVVNAHALHAVASNGPEECCQRRVCTCQPTRSLWLFDRLVTGRVARCGSRRGRTGPICVADSSSAAASGNGQDEPQDQQEQFLPHGGRLLSWAGTTLS